MHTCNNNLPSDSDGSPVLILTHQSWKKGRTTWFTQATGSLMHAAFSSYLIMTRGNSKASPVFALKTQLQGSPILLWTTSEGSDTLIPGLYSPHPTQCKNFKRVQNGAGLTAFKTLCIRVLRGNSFEKTAIKCSWGRQEKEKIPQEAAGASSCWGKPHDGWLPLGTMDGHEGQVFV